MFAYCWMISAVSRLRISFAMNPWINSIDEWNEIPRLNCFHMRQNAFQRDNEMD